MKFFVKKYFTEENFELALQAMRELAEKSRKEEGCLMYALHRDVDDPLAIVLLEEWESLEHQQRHTQTEHFCRLVPEVSKLAKHQEPLTRFEPLD